MNFRRSKPRDYGARGASSDWSYIRLEKGKYARGKASVRRRLEKVLSELRGI